MASELTPALLRSALFASLAIVLLLALRTPLRRWLGAGLAYQAWLIVPLVLAAANLPSRPVPVVTNAPALAPVRELALGVAPATSSQVDWLLLVWACGAAAAAAWFVLGHFAFLHRAGRLRRSGDVYFSDADVGPASVGLLHPRIVLPHDFAQRYSPREQSLVLAHERTHVARRDALANLAAALCQCVFWFNPLVHLGARRFRQDQELACDAAVMRRHPRQHRAYAEALLKCHTGPAGASAGINCHWQSPHPTKERLMSLQHTPSGPFRRLAGRCVLALLAMGAAGATLGVRAEQAAARPTYAVAMELDADGERSSPRILATEGESVGVASGAWRLDMTIHPGPASGEVRVAGKLSKDGELVGTPWLLTRLNEKASIKVGDGDKSFSVSMTVTTRP